MRTKGKNAPPPMSLVGLLRPPPSGGPEAKTRLLLRDGNGDPTYGFFDNRERKTTSPGRTASPNTRNFAGSPTCTARPLIMPDIDHASTARTCPPSALCTTTTTVPRRAQKYAIRKSLRGAEADSSLVLYKSNGKTSKETRETHRQIVYGSRTQGGRAHPPRPHAAMSSERSEWTAGIDI